MAGMVKQEVAYLLPSGEGFRYGGLPYYGFADRGELPRSVRTQVKRWAKRLETAGKNPMYPMDGEVVMGDEVLRLLEQALTEAKAEAGMVPPPCPKCGTPREVGSMGKGEVKYRCPAVKLEDKDFISHLDAGTWYAPQHKQRRAEWLVYLHGEALIALAREAKERRESLELVLGSAESERGVAKGQIGHLRGTLTTLLAEIEAAMAPASYKMTPGIKEMLKGLRIIIKAALAKRPTATGGKAA